MRTNVLECGYTFLSFHDIIPRNELHWAEIKKIFTYGELDENGICMKDFEISLKGRRNYGSF